MEFTPFRSLGNVVRYVGLASALILAGCTAPNLNYLLGSDGGRPELKESRENDMDFPPGEDMPRPYLDGAVLPPDLGNRADLGAGDALPPDVYRAPDVRADAAADAPLDAPPGTPDAGPDALIADATGPTPDASPDVSVADAATGSDSGGIPFLEDLIAMWLFNEPLDADATLLDSSGNGYSGTLASATRIAGRRGNALEFEADNARATIEGIPGFGLGSSLTFSVWYQVRSYDSGAGGGNALAHLARSVGDYNLNIRFNNPDGLGARLQFLFLNESRSSAGVWQSDAIYADPDLTAWHKLDIAFTYGDASSFRAYRDGTPIAGSWGSTDGSAAPYVPPETVLTLGAYRQGGSYSQEFDGVMDDVRLYDRALSEEELLDLYDDEL